MPKKAAVPASGNLALVRLTGIVDRIFAQQARIIDAEDFLARQRAIQRDLLETVLPEAMAAEGVDEFALPSGKKVTVKTQYEAHISQEHRDAAFKYLYDKGLDATLIKASLTVKFGLKEYSIFRSFHNMVRKMFPTMPIRVVWEGADGESDRDVAVALERLIRSALEGRGLTVTDSVPGPTLKKWVREQFEAGNDFPAELFGAVQIRRAVIPGLKAETDEVGELVPSDG
jgi:hypothetical protein